MKYLVAAYAIGSEALGTYIFEQPPLYVRLDRIMHLYVVLMCKDSDMVNSSSEQVHIVVIERSLNFLEVLYSVEIQHVVSFYTVTLRLWGVKRAKTIAKIAKKSVFSWLVVYKYAYYR